MSTMLRRATVLLAGALVVPVVGIGGASAADVTGSATETAGAGAYFSSAGIAKPDAAPVAPPNATNQADGVSPGNLAVAARGGMEDKVSFLLFPLAGAPEGATVTKAVLSVPTVDNAPPGDVSTGGAPAKVSACKPGDTGFGGEDGDALALAPARLCDQFAVAGTPSPDGKAYQFDITKLAATWGQANDGVALTASAGADSTPFQVVFAPFDQARLTYSFTAPAAQDVPSTGPAAPDPLPADEITGTGGTGGSDPVSFDPPAAGDGVVPAEAPVVDPGVPAPTTAQPDSAPAPVTAAPPTTPVASVLPTGVLSPTASAWLAAAAFALLLAFLSLVLGDPQVPTEAAAPSRLSRALQDRERARRPA